MKLDLYLDDHGLPRARWQGPYDLVARFLESDVQGSVATAQDLLGLVDRVESGELESWEGTANIHTLSLGPDGGILVDELDESSPPQNVSLADLREALEAWIALLLEG